MVWSVRTSFLGASLGCGILSIVCLSIVCLSIVCLLVAAPAGAAAAAPLGSAEIGLVRPVATPQVRAVATTAPVDPEHRGGSARLAQLDHQLAEVDALLTAAHFYTALALARATRDRLDTLAANPHHAARRARLEVMAATAEVALGQRARALESMMRALRADPGLSLDERETSPKVLKLLWDARRRTGVEATP